MINYYLIYIIYSYNFNYTFREACMWKRLPKLVYEIIPYVENDRMKRFKQCSKAGCKYLCTNWRHA